jgi:predicted RNA-binding protein with PIN domain
MPYLIDGNNVMAQHVGWHRDKRAARRRLLDELAQFAKDRHATIAVVFDGAPEAHFADGATYKGVRVFYAERGSNADERIKQFVEAARDRRTLLVVTSDRALGEYVRRCGARLLRSGEFRQRMEESSLKHAAEQEDNQAPIPGKDLDEWMRYFGAEEDD